MENWEVWLSFAITWAAGVFGFGKIYGQLVSKINNHDKRIGGIEMAFTGTDGEPRILTVPAHDKLQANCQKHFQGEIDASKKRIDIHDEKLDKILDGIGELKVAIRIRNTNRDD
jgi:hypothetical protein